MHALVKRFPFLSSKEEQVKDLDLKDMKLAIEEGHFEIHYQPQVNIRGTIQSAEALLRWNHKDRGSISPGEFIPFAEENKLINDISDWVIEKVCRQLREWKDKGIKVRPIAINISPIRIMEGGLVELVKEQLTLHDLQADLLEFEITETSLLKNDNHVLNTLFALKDLGIKIAIDDFGTGYSTLEYLRVFQADKIKIDQIFIKELNEGNKNDSAIVSSILLLAKGLGMKIVAEGVEEVHQLKFLKQRDCDIIQGYLFSKPVPQEQFEKMLNTGYLKPKKGAQLQIEEERRHYYRFEFPYDVLGKMTIIEINQRKINIGSSPILIKDISIGGIKIISTLKLPINSEIKFMFEFSLGNHLFKTEGVLKWSEEAKGNMHLYGVKFKLNQKDEDRLALLINKMSVSQNLSQEIVGTEFIYEDSYTFLQKCIS